MKFNLKPKKIAIEKIITSMGSPWSLGISEVTNLISRSRDAFKQVVSICIYPFAQILVSMERVKGLLVKEEEEEEERVASGISNWFIILVECVIINKCSLTEPVYLIVNL